jgi:excisionase family DNA binding protein
MARASHDPVHRPDLGLVRSGSPENDSAIVVISVGQLRQVVREELGALLEGHFRPSEWIAADEVAQMLGYKRAYISELSRRHDLPSHQPSGPGGRHVFRRSEVEAWALQRSEKRL